MGGHDDYTYNDMPRGESDYDLTQFSIAKDEKYIVLNRFIDTVFLSEYGG